MAREALGIVGAAVGFMVGGPAGARIGFMIGTTVGGLMEGPTKIPGPQLAEAPVQTSRDGIPIPIGWGIVHVHGNIIQVNTPYEVTTTERQGKGGGTETSDTRRFQTFAIGLARSSTGPIGGVDRIWEFDKLIYDTRNTPAIPVAETNKTAAGLRIYYGSADQLADPDLESEQGVGSQPVYRGLAYVVFVDKDITDFGSAIPQYRFELNTGADVSESSRIYPIEYIEGLSLSFSQSSGRMMSYFLDGLDLSMTQTVGTLVEKLLTYSDYPPEALGLTYTQDTATLADKLITYLLWPTTPQVGPDALDLSYTQDTGVLDAKLITYVNYKDEALGLSITQDTGTLVVP